MGTFTISFGNNKKTFTTNLSAYRSSFFKYFGSNLKGSKTSANGITVSSQEDFEFAKKAFIDLAKGDGNASDITDNDFTTIEKNNPVCNGKTVAKNIWHSHEPGEYIYHKGDSKGVGVGNTIWLSNQKEDGV